MTRIMIALVTAVVLVATTGCASLSNGSATAKTAIQIAVFKLIDKDRERAQDVYDTVSKTVSLIDGEKLTTLDAVESGIRAEIDPSDYTPSEKLVISRSIDAVRAEIETRINADGVGSLDPDQVVAIKSVLNWVRQAAVMAGAKPDAKTESNARPSSVPDGRARTA